MKLVLVSAFFIIGSFAAPPVDKNPVTVLLYENNNDGLGNYNFAYKTSDGTSFQERSEVVNAGDPKKESKIVRGTYSFVGPDSITYTVTYIADNDGFHPTGDHLPGSNRASKQSSKSKPKSKKRPDLDIRFNDRF